MREKVALVVSRKFNAGHYSHVAATRKLLSENGWCAYSYMHPLFRGMCQENSECFLTTLRQVRSVAPIDLLVVWFPSLRALADIVLARLCYGGRIVYIFHEPFESIASYWKAGFGVRKTFRICLVSVINCGIVLLSHKVILSSHKAESVFRARYSSIQSDFGIIPLLFDDESLEPQRGMSRNFIAYIGTIAADHAFGEFLTFIVHAFDSGWFLEHRYLIATASVLTSAEEALIAPLRTSGKLVVKQGHPLSNVEINDCYAKSLVVWNAYKRSMQSGVLAKCYMFGTPVLVATSNQSEYFVDHENGVLIEDSYRAEQIRDAIAEIITNFAEYSAHCRRRFLETFYYKGQAQAFMGLVTK